VDGRKEEERRMGKLLQFNIRPNEGQIKAREKGREKR